MLVKIRQDLWEDELMPGLMKGWSDAMVELLVDTNNECTFKAKYLEEEYDGYNIVIWHPEYDFVDLANTIDFDLFEDTSND